MFALVAYARAPWAAGDIPNTAPPGQQIPPPVPGGTTAFTFTAQQGAAAWALRSWAGGSQVPVWPGGGVILVPDAARGVMRVYVWWPDATDLLVVRITPDSTRTPVRGGYPARPTTATRRNYATNPGLEAGLNGYVSSDGSPTLSTVAGAVGANALRATVAGAGSLGVTVPHSLAATPQATIGVALNFSARPTGVTISLAYNNSTGGALTPSVITLTADQINNSVGQWGRQTGTVTAPASAATVGSIKVLATGMPAGGTMDLDALTIEQGQTDGTAFDGETLGGTWTGTRYLSTSVLAPVIVIDDGECPLDTGVVYEVYYASVVGGRVTSQQSLLPSGDRTWLTHPATPGAPFVVQPSAPTFTRTYPVDQGVFHVLGRARPLVVSAQQRYSATGTITFGTLSAEEREQLLTTVDDLAPVLLRTPGGYDPGDMWLALGELTVDTQGRMPWQDTRMISAPFVEVDPPDPTVTG